MPVSNANDAKNTEPRLLKVEVAYATPEKQLIIALEVPEGTTAFEAVQLSNIVEEFPAIDLAKDPMGIFSKPLDGKGKPLPQEYILQTRDRVEIYRPLILDPKQARLKRADEKIKAEAAKLAERKQAKAKQAGSAAREKKQVKRLPEGEAVVIAKRATSETAARGKTVKKKALGKPASNPNKTDES